MLPLPLLPLLSLLLPAARAQEAYSPDSYFEETFPSTWGQVRYTGNGEDPWVPSFPDSLTDPSAEQLLWPRLSAQSARSPSMQFTFPMTRFWIYGALANASDASDAARLALRVDGREVPGLSAREGLLCESPELLWGSHNVMLDLFGGDATVRIDNITVATGSKGAEHDANQRQTHRLITGDGKLNEGQFNFTGAWNVSSVLENTNRTIAREKDIQYPQAIGGRNSALFLNIPKGTSFVQVNGSVGPWGKFYSLTFDPPPPLAKEGDLAYDGVRPFEIPAVLFAAPLDPDVEYNATLNVADDPVAMQLGVSAVTFWSGLGGPDPDPNPDPGPDGGDDGGGTNVGAIVGGVVGGVGGALVLALVGWLFYRLGKKRSGRKYANAGSVDLADDGFVTDDSAAGTPYRMDRAEAQTVTPAEPAAAGGRAGARPILPPLVTETKSALDASPATTSSARLLAPAAGDMLLSPGASDSPESTWRTTPSHATANTFGQSSSDVPLTPLERETKAAIPPSPVGAAPAPAAAVAERRQKAPLRPLRIPARRVAQEEDAGAFPAPAEDLELVPPSYNPEWARERQQGSPVTPVDPATPVVPSPLSSEVARASPPPSPALSPLPERP